MAPLHRAIPLSLTTFRATQIPPSTRISVLLQSNTLHHHLRTPSSLPHSSSFSTSARSPYPRKDSQHKDSINTEATEYSKSSTDDESARQGEAAFDPNITDPQEQYDKAGEGRGDKNNPLDVSPANTDVSEQKGDRTEHAEREGSRERTSGGSSPRKGSQVS